MFYFLFLDIPIEKKTKTYDIFYKYKRHVNQYISKQSQ
nr:hypothetical protein PPFHPHBJ_00037 [Cydia pomonella granulovirus]WOZ30544.1 hypothetical protein AGHAAFNI_00130 [Cydia pomonella granulovirus]WOZ30677.1 hypothetical protein KFGOHAPD_00002 [Cydia pomonella granulovirus]WOZ44813.1 hypothetical protein HDNAPKKO_00039 [Cydia pomonella granulovirus]WOZ44949.1 hypothetical protein GGGKFHNK_00037 [Cydia pomonella granulovirus]